MTATPHRATARAAALLTVLALGATAACSSDDGGKKPEDKAPASTSAPASSGGSSAAASLEGAPAPLATVVNDLYAGKPVTATGEVTAALAKGKAVTGPVTGKAAVGAWKNEQVAVVTHEQDVTLAVAGADGKWRVVGGWWPSKGVEGPVLGSSPRFVLGIGSDARPGEDQTRTRADTEQIIGIDGKGGGGVVGIARDLWVPIAGGGHGKINSALPRGGPNAQLQTVKDASGLPIEGYVVVGFDSFTKIIDELGGIPIVVPKAVKGIGTGLDIKAGPQVMDGNTALQYARERKSLPDGDFGRSRHQGEILVAAAVKGKLEGPLILPKAIAATNKHAASNLSAEQILTFTAWFYKLDPTKVGRGVAQGPIGRSPDGQSIVQLESQARGLFDDLKDGNLQ